jgi:hypothetical protein
MLRLEIVTISRKDKKAGPVYCAPEVDAEIDGVVQFVHGLHLSAVFYRKKECTWFATAIGSRHHDLSIDAAAFCGCILAKGSHGFPSALGRNQTLLSAF